MKSFFRSYLAALFAGITFFFFGFLIILLSGGSKDTDLRGENFLHIELSGTMQDFVPMTEFPGFNEIFGGDIVMSMEEMVFNIRKAAEDENITGIYLDLDFFTAGTAQLREVRQALEAFKEEGKTVYAYGQVITRPGYYLASVADSIWLSPSGVVEWSGLSSSVPYLKGALDKLGVEMQLIRGRDNAYKSAGEPYIAETMSDANREQISSYLNSIWTGILADVAGDGRLTEMQLDEIALTGALIFPNDALALGMVDGLAHEDEVLSRFAEDRTSPDFDDLNLVSLSRYTNVPASKKGDLDSRIAVLYAEGEVTLGTSGSETMGSETIIEALRDIRTNDRIKGVVLRINSPGGVSLAGDAMLREVELLTREKPVVVSMGNVAASAGYLIAAPADTILVQPQTITGSIGVFAMIPAAQELLNDKLGIRFQNVTTHPLADLGTLDRPLNDVEKEVLQNSVDRTYESFREQVSIGRGMDRSAVDSLARGRVWTGSQAIENGLADAEGGLIDAIEIVKKMAGIEGKARISSYPEMEDPFTAWLNSMGGATAGETLREELGPLYPAYMKWKSIERMTGIQKRLPEYSMEQPL